VDGERHVLVVMSNCLGDDAAFNTWYETVHVPDVLALPGFVRARRYRVRPGLAQNDGAAHEFVTLFEIEGDPAAALAALHAATPAMDLAEGLLDLEHVRGWVLTPISDATAGPSA
jgi:hypothetical protein